jgi:hypothetical protein
MARLGTSTCDFLRTMVGAFGIDLFLGPALCQQLDRHYSLREYKRRGLLSE